MCRKRACAVAIGLFVGACSDPGPGPLVMEILPREASISLNDTVRLSATVTQGGASVQGTVNWTSRRPEVATIDAGGLVRGVNPGVATIVAIAAATPNVADSVGVVVFLPASRMRRQR